MRRTLSGLQLAVVWAALYGLLSLVERCVDARGRRHAAALLALAWLLVVAAVWVATGGPA